MGTTKENTLFIDFAVKVLNFFGDEIRGAEIAKGFILSEGIDWILFKEQWETKEPI